jgi:hypothetical protein
MFTGDKAAVACVQSCAVKQKDICPPPTSGVSGNACACDCGDIDRYNKGMFTGDAAAVACVQSCAAKQKDICPSRASSTSRKVKNTLLDIGIDKALHKNHKKDDQQDDRDKNARSDDQQNNDDPSH